MTLLRSNLNCRRSLGGPIMSAFLFCVLSVCLSIQTFAKPAPVFRWTYSEKVSPTDPKQKYCVAEIRQEVPGANVALQVVYNSGTGTPLEVVLQSDQAIQVPGFLITFNNSSERYILGLLKKSLPDSVNEVYWALPVNSEKLLSALQRADLISLQTVSAPLRNLSATGSSAAISKLVGNCAKGILPLNKAFESEFSLAPIGQTQLEKLTPEAIELTRKNYFAGFNQFLKKLTLQKQIEQVKLKFKKEVAARDQIVRTIQSIDKDEKNPLLLKIQKTQTEIDQLAQLIQSLTEQIAVEQARLPSLQQARDAAAAIYEPMIAEHLRLYRALQTSRENLAHAEASLNSAVARKDQAEQELSQLERRSSELSWQIRNLENRSNELERRARNAEDQVRNFDRNREFRDRLYRNPQYSNASSRLNQLRQELSRQAGNVDRARYDANQKRNNYNLCRQDPKRDCHQELAASDQADNQVRAEEGRLSQMQGEANNLQQTVSGIERQVRFDVENEYNQLNNIAIQARQDYNQNIYVIRNLDDELNRVQNRIPNLRSEIANLESVIPQRRIDVRNYTAQIQQNSAALRNYDQSVDYANKKAVFDNADLALETVKDSIVNLESRKSSAEDKKAAKEKALLAQNVQLGKINDRIAQQNTKLADAEAKLAPFYQQTKSASDEINAINALIKKLLEDALKAF